MSRLRQFLKSALTTALPSSLLLTHGLRCNDASSPIKLALTFDDGPHPEHTPRLLDQLAENGAIGTFFVIGEKAQQSPELIRRIAAEGHELGNHTWTHGEPSQTSAAMFLDEVRRTRQLLQDLSGHDCRLMRPPKGQLSVRKGLGLWRAQQTIVLWNVDPKDFAMCDGSEMTRWLKSYRPESGDIVLLHDNHSHAAVCVAGLSSATKSELRFITVSQCLAAASSRQPETVRPMLRESCVGQEVSHVR